MTELNVIQELSHLERQILIGKQAVTHRNGILTHLYNQGHTYASLYRLLNTVRDSVGAPHVTRDAVPKAITRHKARVGQ